MQKGVPWYGYLAVPWLWKRVFWLPKPHWNGQCRAFVLRKKPCGDTQHVYALKRNGIFFVTYVLSVRYFRVIFNCVAVRRRRSLRPPQSLSSNDDVPVHGHGRSAGIPWNRQNIRAQKFAKPLVSSPPTPRTRITYPFRPPARTRFSSFGGRPSEKRIRAHVRKPVRRRLRVYGSGRTGRCNFNIRIGCATSSCDVENGERLDGASRVSGRTTKHDDDRRSVTRPVFRDGNGQRVVATIRFRSVRHSGRGGGGLGQWSASDFHWSPVD